MSTVEPETISPASNARAAGAFTCCAAARVAGAIPSWASVSGDIVAASANASSLGLPVAATSLSSAELTASSDVAGATVAAACGVGAVAGVPEAAVLTVAAVAGAACPAVLSISPAVACSVVVLATSAFCVTLAGLAREVVSNSAEVGIAACLKAVLAESKPS